ncbi:hypothetical protein [Halobellus rufus]|uniref:hypothetical protein n=1 Tax=Halobellus rufus TaxID=1448860 RepID=UPI000678AE69|nr:hypothetical protein [Halobellus rufus]
MSNAVERNEGDVGASLLAELAEREEVVDDVARNAADVEAHTETVEVTTHDRLRVSDTQRREVLPKSEYERKSGSRVSMANRWREAPSGFAAKTVRYITDTTPSECSRCSGSGRKSCPSCSGSGTETCSDCAGDGRVECAECSGSGKSACATCNGSGTVTESEERQCERCTGGGSIECPDCLGRDDDCPNCGGASTVTCPDCDGDGVVEGDVSETCPDCGGDKRTVCGTCSGDGTTRCRTCSGDGDVTCEECDGAGDVECDRCDGEGQTAKATLGELSFERNQQLDTDADSIPGAAFRRGDGTEIETTHPVDGDRPDGSGFGSHLYRHRIARSRADCESAAYSYDGKRYWVARVDGDLRYEDFPNDPEHLEQSIDEAKDNDVFRLRPQVGTREAVATSARRLGLDLAKFVGVAVALVIVFIVAAIVASIGGIFGQTVQNVLFYFIGTVASVGLAVGVFTMWWDDRETNDGPGASRSPYSRWDLLLPLAAGVLVGAAFVGSVGGELLRWQAAMLVMGLWAGRVGTWLDYEGNRLAYVASQRKALLDRLTVDDDTLAKHGLRDRLPPAEWTLGPTFYRRAGLAVFALGWGGSAAVFCLLFLASFISIDTAVVRAWVRPFAAGFVLVTAAGLASTLVPRVVD